MTATIHLNVKVPKKLSDWAELALKDAIAVSKRKGVVMDMGYWMLTYDTGCSVCLAGAVMLKRFPKSPIPSYLYSTCLSGGKCAAASKSFVNWGFEQCLFSLPTSPCPSASSWRWAGWA